MIISIPSDLARYSPFNAGEDVLLRVDYLHDRLYVEKLGKDATHGKYELVYKTKLFGNFYESLNLYIPSDAKRKFPFIEGDTVAVELDGKRERLVVSLCTPMGG